MFVTFIFDVILPNKAFGMELKSCKVKKTNS